MSIALLVTQERHGQRSLKQTKGQVRRGVRVQEKRKVCEGVGGLGGVGGVGVGSISFSPSSCFIIICHNVSKVRACLLGIGRAVPSCDLAHTPPQVGVIVQKAIIKPMKTQSSGMGLGMGLRLEAVAVVVAVVVAGVVVSVGVGVVVVVGVGIEEGLFIALDAP